MSETEVITIGEPMPRLASVARHGAYEIVVGWAAGSTREHNADLVDLAPLILTHKFYKPLRDNPDLFNTVHMIEDGSAVAWGDDDAIDMAATSIERLAEEQMSTADFRAWLEQHKLTYDAAAAQLGISRRLVAYYADQRPVPRYIALACRYLDLEQATTATAATRSRPWPGLSKLTAALAKENESTNPLWRASLDEPMPSFLAERIGPPTILRAQTVDEELKYLVVKHIEEAMHATENKKPAVRTKPKPAPSPSRRPK
jgi:hypothetical protein